ncbi:DUF4265 domain-containing protein [Nocardiopsis sp. NPDC101807]|uniref:DUF4265 domain-containing protein n=1 Tax=Nocardiopsis sp. NPDC101807 TaxID=3364339 RepID=UPI0038042D78
MDGEGRPPADVESLWAADLGKGTVRLENTPWFVRGVAAGDVIRVQPDDDGVLWAGETVQPSHNCTIRLIVLKDDGSAAARLSVLKVFHRLGTTGEGIEQFRMVAWTSRRRRTCREFAPCWSTAGGRSGGTGKKGASPTPGGPLRQSEDSGAACRTRAASFPRFPRGAKGRRIIAAYRGVQSARRWVQRAANVPRLGHRAPLPSP